MTIRRVLSTLVGFLLVLTIASCDDAPPREDPRRPVVEATEATETTETTETTTETDGADLVVTAMRRIAENGGRCAWSPDGGRIAFDRKGPDGYYDLWVMNADGTGATCLTCTGPAGFPRRHAGNPSWHPSGRYILANVEKDENPLVGKPLVEAYAEPGIGRNNDLWLVAADGSRAWRLWENPTPASIIAPQPALYNARFSHDGTRIAWTHSPTGKGGAWGEFVIRVAGFSLDPAPRLDAASLVEHRPQGGNFQEVHGWTPDDRRLDVSGNWRGGHEYDQDAGLLDLGTGEVTNLTPAPEGVWTEATHMRPQGDAIVFMSSEGYPLRGSQNWWTWLRTDYWAVRTDGTGKRRLTFFNEPGHAEWNGDMVNVAQFSWKPDGSAFCGVMNRTPPGGRGALEIWVFDVGPP